MRCLDRTFDSPVENLACDEALLDFCEAGDDGEILRFWEPDQHFVVVGYGKSVVTEVNVTACEAARIPIFRRCSGGGTILQGPGCLNYSLVLRIEENGPLGTIAETNALIMQTNKKALQRLVSERIEIRGHTDLAIDNVKFSGNAQRRRRRFLLFHGSILLRFDLNLIEQFLPLPLQQPGYRQGRPHRDFLRNLNLPAGSIIDALQRAWRAAEPFEQLPYGSIARLAEERYSTPQWNLKLEQTH